VKICEMMGTGSSSASKGMRKDARQKESIKKCENLRRNQECANDFMKTLAAICPEYYGAQS